MTCVKVVGEGVLVTVKRSEPPACIVPAALIVYSVLRGRGSGLASNLQKTHGKKYKKK